METQQHTPLSSDADWNLFNAFNNIAYGENHGHGHLLGYPISRNYHADMTEPSCYSIDDSWEPLLHGRGNIEHIAGLVLNHLSLANLQRLTDHAPRFTGLSALVIHNDQTEHADALINLIEQLPNLQYLHFQNQIDLGMRRFPNITQLSLSYNQASTQVLQSSFPNLTYLAATIDDGFTDTFNQCRFEHLRHIEFHNHHTFSTLETIAELNIPDSVSALTFNGTEEDDIPHVIKLPFAKRLTHLIFKDANCCEPEGINSDNFPALRYLAFSNPWGEGYPYETFAKLGPLSPELTLDLSFSCFTGEEESIEDWMGAPIFKAIKRLNLDHNFLDSDESWDFINALPCEVIRGTQLPYDVWYDEVYE